MYQKPGEGLASAHAKKVESSFRRRKPLNGDGMSSAARKALAEAKAKKLADEQARQAALIRAQTAEAMARIANAQNRGDLL